MTHSELCLLAAKWLKNAQKPCVNPSCPYVVVEITTASPEIPDVFGWNYWTTVLIEVKMSRGDFLADFKKPFRKVAKNGIGALRYYCCPSKLINDDEVPENWGLLWENNGKIEVIKTPVIQERNAQSEVAILSSIMRRENVKPKIFNYKKL